MRVAVFALLLLGLTRTRAYPWTEAESGAEPTQGNWIEPVEGDEGYGVWNQIKGIGDMVTDVRAQLVKAVSDMVSSFNSVTQEKDQLAGSNAELAREKAQLQTSLETMTREKEEQETSFNNLHAEKDELQTSYNGVVAEKEELQASYMTLVGEKEELQAAVQTLTKEKDEQQAAFNELQSSYNTVVAEKDELQSSYNGLVEEKDQLQVGLESLTREKNEQLNSNNNLLGERELLEKEVERLNEMIKADREQHTEQHTQLTRQRDELLEETDKLKASKGPCPAGWDSFGSSCYFVSNERRTWDNSRQFCKEAGGDLVVINSRKEQEFINGLHDGNHTWIGLSDKAEEGAWIWVDGTPVTETYWLYKQPDNMGGIQHCGCFWHSSAQPGGWGDERCSWSRHWICEK